MARRHDLPNFFKMIVFGPAHCVPGPRCPRLTVSSFQCCRPVVSKAHHVQFPLSCRPVVSKAQCVQFPLSRKSVVSKAHSVQFPFHRRSVVYLFHCVPASSSPSSSPSDNVRIRREGLGVRLQSSMLTTRKSVPRSSKQSDHAKIS